LALHAKSQFYTFIQVFERMWLGSAFKGANGPAQTYIDINRYLETHESYMRLLTENRQTLTSHLVGIVITGWQRFDHFAGLCELLPIGIPSLASALLFLADKRLVRQPDLQQRVRKVLGCPDSSPVVPPFSAYTTDPAYVPPESTIYMQCLFPGSDLFDLVENLRFQKMQIERFLADPTVLGWMGEYQLTRQFGSKHYALKHSLTARDLLQDLVRSESRLRDALRTIYYPDAVDEWMYSNVRSPLTQLQSFVLRAERILNVSSFPSRPLPRDTATV
jgi:hexosaminidase